MAFGVIKYLNNTATIDVSDGDRTIFAHDIYLSGGTPIILEGDGTLIVIVENFAEFKQFPKKEDGTPAEASQFLILLLPGANMDITANADLNGFIYGPSATVTMNTGNAIFSGAVICESFVGSNGEVNYFNPAPNFPLAANVFSGFDFYQWER
jgi:hypothetical protein